MSEPVTAAVVGQILITHGLDSEGDETVFVEMPGVANIVTALGMLRFAELQVFRAYGFLS